MDSNSSCSAPSSPASSNSSSSDVACEICSQTFSRKDDKNRHVIESHHGGNMVECRFCHAMLQKRSLFRHLRTTNACPAKYILRAYESGVPATLFLGEE